MKVCVASGKGGTGKTTVAVNIAVALSHRGEPVQLVDCDVEEPNVRLFVKPSWKSRRSAFTLVPRVDKNRCTHCGLCSEVCQFHAVLVSSDNVFFQEEMCHSCGACVELCPEKALREASRRIGEIEQGGAFGIRLVRGRLNPGEAMSPPLIRQVKRLVSAEGVAILDCPPGTSCPVVESVKGCDFCVLVTEATPFGLNDLRLAVEMLRHLRVPGGVVINRYDLGDGRVRDYCVEAGLPVLMCMPYDVDLARLYARGIPVSTVSREWERRFWALWDRVRRTWARHRQVGGSEEESTLERAGRVTVR